MRVEFFGLFLDFWTRFGTLGFCETSQTRADYFWI